MIPVESGAPSNQDNDNEYFHSCVGDCQPPTTERTFWPWRFVSISWRHVCIYCQWSIVQTILDICYVQSPQKHNIFLLSRCFTCPHKGCIFVSNSIILNCDREKNCIPKPKGNGLCFTHKCSLGHVPGEVECTLIWMSTSTEINQIGSHFHPWPRQRIQRMLSNVSKNIKRAGAVREKQGGQISGTIVRCLPCKQVISPNRWCVINKVKKGTGKGYIVWEMHIFHAKVALSQDEHDSLLKWLKSSTDVNIKTKRSAWI